MTIKIIKKKTNNNQNSFIYLILKNFMIKILNHSKVVLYQR